MVPLETLDRHDRAIVLAWWFGFLGGPVWVAALAVVIRRRSHSRDLRWVVDQGGTA